MVPWMTVKMFLESQSLFSLPSKYCFCQIFCCFKQFCDWLCHYFTNLGGIAMEWMKTNVRMSTKEAVWKRVCLELQFSINESIRWIYQKPDHVLHKKYFSQHDPASEKSSRSAKIIKQAFLKKGISSDEMRWDRGST